MQRFKIKKEFWLLILSGEKKYEYRKMKTLRRMKFKNGICEFTSIEETPGVYAHGKCLKKPKPKEIYGTAYVAKNKSLLLTDYSVKNKVLDRVQNKEIDWNTYFFVKDYYLDKGSFMELKITEPKENNV